MMQHSPDMQATFVPGHKLTHLPAFIRFILENKLEEFIRLQIQISRDIEAPVMKFFEGMPDDQLIQFSLEPTRAYWNYLVEGDIDAQLKDVLEKWKTNQLPGIERDQIVAEDITKGNYVRKTALTQLLPAYTSNFETYRQLSNEIDHYLQIVASATFNTYLEIQNARLDKLNTDLQRKEEQLLAAQEIARMGSFEWCLNDPAQSYYSPQLLQLFGLKQTTTLTDFMEHVHPADRTMLQDAIQQAIATNGLFECEYRYQYNGPEKVLWCRGKLRKGHTHNDFLSGTVMDVTENHRVVQELKQRDALYKQSQQLTHIGNWAWDVPTNTITWSDELYRIYGLEPQSETITFERFISFVHPDDREKRLQQVEQTLQGKPHDHVMRIRTVTGEEKVLKGKSEVSFNAQGEVISVTGTCQDITAEYQLQKQLEEEVHFVESLIDSSVDLITVFDQKLNLIAINKKALERFNLNRKDVLGKHVTEVFPFSVGSPYLTELQQGLNGETIHHAESKSLISENYYEQYFIPLTNARGETHAVLALNHDITDIKKVNIEISSLNASLELKNELLRRSEELHQKMVAEVEDYAILLLDPNGIVRNWNLGAEKIKGYKAAEIIGKSFELFYEEADRKSGLPYKLLNEAATKGRAVHEGWRVRKDGTRFWGSIVITALHGSNKEIIGFSKLTRDLSERKQAEEQLRLNNALLQQLNQSLELKNQLLERSNKELSAFSYIASHDLQEPLRKIKTFVNLIAEKEAEGLQPRQRELLDRVMVSANNMQRLIEDLLSYSRTHNSSDQFQRIDLNELLQSYKEELLNTLQKSSVTVTSDPLPVISGIRFQLHQLFDNLIGNSIKYAKAGVPVQVSITARRVPGIEIVQYGGSYGTTYHLLQFSDNGIGFEQKYAERIFEPFQRLHGKNEYSGTGIGLAICKKIVQNHGGVIFAQSEPGAGARFYVAFPVID